MHVTGVSEHTVQEALNASASKSSPVGMTGLENINIKDKST